MNFRVNSQCNRRLTWSPKGRDSNQSETVYAWHSMHVDNGKRWQNEVCLSSRGHSLSSKLELRNKQTIFGMATWRCNNNTTIHNDLFSCFLPSKYTEHRSAARPRWCMSKWQDGDIIEFIILSVYWILRLGIESLHLPGHRWASNTWPTSTGLRPYSFLSGHSTFLRAAVSSTSRLCRSDRHSVHALQLPSRCWEQ